MNTPYLADLTKTDWLCLSFLSSIGPSRLSRLFTYLQQLDAPTADCISYEVLTALKWPDVTAREAMAYLSNGALTKEQAIKRDDSLTWLAKDTHSLVLQNDEAYPSALKEINVAPAFLYVEGQLDTMRLPKLGIVGARKCTRYARDATLQLAGQLSAHGICVVSGGAMGIDTAAHQGALQDKTTPTIAIMGTGLLHRYPSQNRRMFDEILEQGALVSEYPLTTSPRPHLFPPRNRIISGVSMGVLVAEASIKSGSLISASYAVQQNRDVFALPGRLTDVQSEGCHQLIRQGATLVRRVEDILEEYADLSQTNKTQSMLPLGQRQVSLQLLPTDASKQAKDVLACLERDTTPMDFDELIRQTQMPAGDMMQALMELELYGCVENRSGLYGRC